MTRFVGRAVLLLLVAGMLGLRVDTLDLSPGRASASSHLFSVAAWEARNLPDKWLNLLWEAWPGNRPSRQERLRMVDEYLQLALLAEKEQDRIEGRFLVPGATTASGAGAREAGRQSREYLDELLSTKRDLRDRVEEAVEAELSALLVEEGLGSRLGLLFPPVDLRFAKPPTLLVTSPRDRIERLETLLLTPDMPVLERDAIETQVLESHDLSALVVDLRGLSTYPTLASELEPLRAVLQTAAHEWLHAYLFFRPLGFRYRTSEEMFTLNETAAALAGRELGDMTFARMGGDLSISPSRFLSGEDRFPRFTQEMRETRVGVDERLDRGEVEQAEEYMRDRWWFLALRGFRLRKLNQAYFAFHGLYAQSPGSVSPIGDQLEELRGYLPGVGSFVETVSAVSSYGEFLDLIESYRSAQPPAPD